MVVVPPLNASQSRVEEYSLESQPAEELNSDKISAIDSTSRSASRNTNRNTGRNARRNAIGTARCNADSNTGDLTAEALQNLQPQWRGKLGFRFYDDRTNGIRDGQGFRALAFAASPIPPMETDIASLQALAFLHLRPVRHPSHFISLFTNLRPALHRALRSSSNARVAIINMDYLLDHPVAGLPRAFDAAKVAQQFDITGFDWRQKKEYGYEYTAEYVVWGRIEREAIVADFPIGRLSVRSYIPLTSIS